MSEKPQGGPCSWKAACKSCTAALNHDRPHLCVDLACNHYTPCRRCGNNRLLTEDELCNVCIKELRSDTQSDKASTPIVELGVDGELVETTADLKQAVIMEELHPGAAHTERKLSVSRPGQPPPEYSETEKEIYNSDWKEYQGYYRDPTAKFTIHSIIILQIELSWLLSEMTTKRGKPDKALENQRTRLVRGLKELRDQLPTKEANEESDDEKFFSTVYQKYIEECQDRRLGKVARYLSPEAIALAPVLHFPINPQQLLSNLGVRLVDAAEACDHILLDELPKEPHKVLEFFGFFLREKYAAPLDTVAMEDEEEPLPSVASPELLNAEDKSNGQPTNTVDTSDDTDDIIFDISK